MIFEISRDVCQGGGDWTCRLDFLPEVSSDELHGELTRRRETNLPVSELLTGILHNRLGRVLTQNAGLSANGLVRDLSDWGGCPSLKGVRTNCRAEILHNGEKTAESTGQL